MRKETPAGSCGFAYAFALAGLGLTTMLAAGNVSVTAEERTPQKATALEIALPPGTILPVKLDHGISSKHTQPGKKVSARIMQNVPLPGGGKIPGGAHVRGSVVAVTPGASGKPAELTLRFDELDVHGRRMAITTNLRAIASLSEVQEAEVPQYSIGFGTSYNWAPTVQIGGDIKYGFPGVVTDRETHEVGKGVYDGVLVHVRSNEERNCRGPLDGEDRLQALWLFSSDACGVYGLDDTQIAHAGRSEPVGTIVLRALHGDVNLRGGTGMLLRVIGKNPETTQP